MSPCDSLSLPGGPKFQFPGGQAGYGEGTHLPEVIQPMEDRSRPWPAGPEADTSVFRTSVAS